MPGSGPQGRGEVGETVAEFTRYESAQKAVSALIAGEVPARDIAIVGRGLRSIERVTGKLGYATAARSGAVNGLLLGLLFAAFFVLGDSSVQVSVFVGVLFVGIALGMLLSLGAYAIVRRRKDFASVMQVVAEEYEVTVLASSIHRAREILTASEHAGAMPGARRPAQPAPPPAPSDEPPRYGERIQPPQRPQYGEMRPTEPSETTAGVDASQQPSSVPRPDADERGGNEGAAGAPAPDDAAAHDGGQGVGDTGDAGGTDDADGGAEASDPDTSHERD